MCIELIVHPRNFKLYLENVKFRRKRICGNQFPELTVVELEEYFDLLLLAEVQISHVKTTSTHLDIDVDQYIFKATMFLQQIHIISCLIHFNKKKNSTITK